MSQTQFEFTVFDDNGVLSLADCNAYDSFVSEDWTYESIVSHFNAQMAQRSILVWEGGDGGGPYSILVRLGWSEEIGVREAVGPITVTADHFNIVSYDALTMAAQFDDEILPSKTETNWVVPINAGTYLARIVQTFDPDRATENPAPHFIVELKSGEMNPWPSPMWLRT